MSNNKQSMKLYTEEQVIQAFKSGMNACMKHKDWALAINYPNKIELLEYMQSLTPIEIPSDEEIIQWAKKQTAVEWLTEKVNSKEWQDMYIWHKEEVFKEAKEMEKEQIIRAFVVAEGAEYEGIKYGVHYYRKTYLKDA